MAYHIALRGGEEGLRFPDLVRLDSEIRQYNPSHYRYHNSRLSEHELRQMQARAQFWEDLGLDDFDTHFLQHHRTNSDWEETKGLAKKGREVVLKALRGFTIDTSTLDYRLDIQEDLEREGITEAFGEFYEQLVTARQTYESGFARDHRGARKTDDTGRYVYTDYSRFPNAFRILDKAIRDMRGKLETTTSDGMKEVADYLDHVTQSEEYQRWNLLLDAMSGEKDLGFIVRFGFDGEPLKALMMGGFGDESDIERLLKITPNQAGQIKIDGAPEVIAARAETTIKKDLAYILEAMFDIKFDGLDSFIPQLKSGLEEQLSFYAALGELYLTYEQLGITTTRPEFDPMSRSGEIEGAVHPVIVREAREKGRSPVANDLQYDPNRNLYVVNGPNDGGKSVFGKTMGLTMLMAQAGMRVPAQRVRISPVGEIYTHFVSQDDLEKGKGRHRNELTGARAKMESITPHYFLIFDEPCGGTDSTQGLEDSRALVDYAHRVGTPTIFITHLHGLAQDVEEGRWKGAANLQAEILDPDGEGILTWRIVPGRAKGSYGSRISEEVGVTPEALNELLEQRIRDGQLDPESIRET